MCGSGFENTQENADVVTRLRLDPNKPIDSLALRARDCQHGTFYPRLGQEMRFNFEGRQFRFGELVVFDVLLLSGPHPASR